ncbi:MAG: hypothetical protein Kow0040_07840 [Thermogutta sp.]
MGDAMSPAAESVVRRLDSLRQQWWIFTLLSSLATAASLSLGLFLVFMLADAVFRFPQSVLLGAFLCWVAVSLGALVWAVRRASRGHRTLEATARRVELEFPELESSLINILQLASDTRQDNPAFCLAAVHQAVSRANSVRLEETPFRRTRWERFRYCMQTSRDFLEWSGVLVTLILISIVMGLLLPNWSSAASRLLQPWQFVPSVGRVRILSVEPGNCEVFAGSTVRVAAKISMPGQGPYPGFLFVAPEGEPEQKIPMAAEKEGNAYVCTIPAVLKPLQYRLEIGDTQSSVYRVGITEVPAPQEVEVTYNYPAYMGRPSDTYRQRTLDLRAPQYSEAVLRVMPSAVVSGGRVTVDGQVLVGSVEDGGRAFVVKLPMLKDGNFTVALQNAAGLTDPNPRTNRVSVVPDRPPAVEILKPVRQTSASPGETIAVKVRAADDYAVGEIRLEMKVQEQSADGPPPTDGGENSTDAQASTDDKDVVRLHSWTTFEGTTTVLMEHSFALEPEKFRAGQTVLIRAVAADKRNLAKWGLDLRPQVTVGPWHAVKIVAGEEKTTAALQNLESLRSAVFRILETQIRARATMAALQDAAAPDLQAAQAALKDVRAKQIAVQSGTQEIAATIKDTDSADRLAFKRVLNNLAVNEMLAAVQTSDALLRATSAGESKPYGELTSLQDRIIETLRKLLDLARQAQTELLAEAQKRPGGDLPNDVQKKLEEIQSKLQEFLEQQRKVIEASEELAKKPVEDFTEEDEQKLKELAEVQDDWSRFMAEAHSDLSKLPEQDFSSASMCQELVEIQTELKMAEDALLKKSADIAVPLEQLGYEMAEEITSNLEKWLPDTPDRERWSQEESLTDADKEAPMAELPGQLEDLIGELMEEEEDLFDEMEDVSSSAADSLDKGAGWDAADGPISNMSAKGVTGNRLPNTSEIGGRSGEGRSGKSSGEFVSDEAVGKGGRKTPSRLTADPYMQGQIKDHSKDPTGGATGGGKESGQGGQGLEGPTPPGHGPRELQRLAGKQAELRNKAEAIDAQMQVMNYHRTDMQRLIDLMAEVERDLLAGRYQNALRKREVVLESLASQKQYVGGEFEVRQDASANLPTDVQKEILGSAQDPTPPGWEDLVRGYYRRLMNGESVAATPESAAP